MTFKSGIIVSGIMILFASCGPEDDTTNEIKRKADSLNKEVMEQLKEEGKKGSDTTDNKEPDQ